MKFLNKIAVVTGGSSGIGKAICSRLLDRGYVVVNADIHQPDENQGVVFKKCDVTDPEAINGLYRYVTSDFGIPDVLVSNAGQGIHEKLSEGDPEKWSKVIDINLVGALRFIRAFLPAMLDRKSGAVFFISSTAATRPYEYGAIYAASKAGLNMVARTLQLEVQDVLKVCLVCPGVVQTSFFRNMISGYHTPEDIGFGSLSPEQVADTVLLVLDLPDAVKLPEITVAPKEQPL
jgi:NADP-dependent 3-hydroxy acid dehydrogenase YdfG